MPLVKRRRAARHKRKKETEERAEGNQAQASGADKGNPAVLPPVVAWKAEGKANTASKKREQKRMSFQWELWE